MKSKDGDKDVWARKRIINKIVKAGNKFWKICDNNGLDIDAICNLKHNLIQQTALLPN
jgi:hypothetical protein